MHWELMVGIPIMFFFVGWVLFGKRAYKEDHIDKNPPTHI